MNLAFFIIGALFVLGSTLFAIKHEKWLAATIIFFGLGIAGIATFVFGK